MHEPRFICRPPRPAHLLKGLGVVAGVTAISIAAALCYKQYRKHELMRQLASVPNIASALPALNTNARVLLAALGKPTPSTFYSKP